MIDFLMSDEQQHIRQASHEFAQKTLAGASGTYSKHATQKERFASTRPFYRQAVEAGQLKASIPVPLGGLSTNLVNAAIALEEQYAVDPSVTLTVAGTLLGLLPLIFGGTPEQHSVFLKPFLSGEGEPLASLVHSEPEGTANWLQKGAPGLRTTTRKERDSWIINGTKVRSSPCCCSNTKKRFL